MLLWYQGVGKGGKIYSDSDDNTGIDVVVMDDG